MQRSASRPDTRIPAAPYIPDRDSGSSQEDSESDPSSGQEFSPDYSDTDSSSGEATITAGPTGKGNLIGRATIAAGRATGTFAARHGENGVISESEDETDDPGASNALGVERQSANRTPSSSSSTPPNLKRSLSNPAGWANQVYQGRKSDTPSGMHVHTSWGDAWYSHKRQSSGGARMTMPASESVRSQDALATAVPAHMISTSAPTGQYRYPNPAMGSFGVPQTHQLPIQRPTYQAQRGDHTSRSKPASFTASAAANQTNVNQEKRSPVNGETVSRTTSLPRMPRLHGFSPITSMRTLPNAQDGLPPATVHRTIVAANGITYALEDDVSDQEGIYMDVSQSRRRRSLQRRRKAASDGSRTPVSPALSLSPLVSPALSSLSSSLDSSPISNILGHASSKNYLPPGENQHNYAARTELRKRRGSQQNTQQAHASHPVYPYHVPPRLAHQPRSDFSAASTSAGSADVSSGYTASADSGDTRSDASQSSHGALGLSLGGASGADGGGRRYQASAQDQAHRRVLSDEGTWDSNVRLLHINVTDGR